MYHVYVTCILLYDVVFFFFFNDTATTEIYTLSLHDALPILSHPLRQREEVRHLQARLPGHQRRLGRAGGYDGRRRDDIGEDVRCGGGRAPAAGSARAGEGRGGEEGRTRGVAVH